MSLKSMYLRHKSIVIIKRQSNLFINILSSIFDLLIYLGRYSAVVTLKKKITYYYYFTCYHTNIVFMRVILI